jgi:shikimate kinase
MEPAFCDPAVDPAAAPGSHRELAGRLRGINLYLVGMMGSGKSSIARPLAEALGYRVIDADTVLEQVAGRPIPEIFERDGEAAFRKIETAVLDQLAGWHSLVVATGGGVVSRPENWGRLHQGVVIWLDAPEHLLLRRLRADPTPRPLLAHPDPATRLADLLAARRPLYAQADLTIQQGDEAPAEVAAKVLAALPTILRDPLTPPEHPAQLVDGEGRIRGDLNPPDRPDEPAAPNARRTTES